MTQESVLLLEGLHIYSDQLEWGCDYFNADWRMTLSKAKGCTGVVQIDEAPFKKKKALNSIKS